MTKPILFFLVLATFAHADKREEAWRAEDERQWTADVANARCRPLLESGLALSLETVNAAVKVGENAGCMHSTVREHMPQRLLGGEAESWGAFPIRGLHGSREDSM